MTVTALPDVGLESALCASLRPVVATPCATAQTHDATPETR
jgi:hypothetical protein